MLFEKKYKARFTFVQMCTLSKIAQKDDFGGLTAVPGHEKTTFYPNITRRSLFFIFVGPKKAPLVLC
jgi:hypothetical protein